MTFRVDGYEEMQGLVAAGFGVSMAPALSLGQHRPDVAVRAVSQPSFTRQVSVLTLVDGARLAPLADFIAILSQVTGAGQRPSS
jgi:DNA-binding transcriptional LysR family regulator